MLAHVLTLSGWVIPLADLLFPALVGWCMPDSDYVGFHARSSLRFQVSNLICKVAFLTMLGGCYLLLRHFDTAYDLSVGVWLLAPALISLVIVGVLGVVALLVMVLDAGVWAHGGIRYRYPLTLRCLG